MTLTTGLTTVLAAAVAAGTLAVTSTGTSTAGGGSTSMPDQVLRTGCRAYTYGYSLSPSTGDWQAEMFLLDPDRNRVSSGVLDSATEARRGTARFWLCGGSTRYGVFKIRGKLTTYDGWQQSAAWITPSYVRLHRRR